MLDKNISDLHGLAQTEAERIIACCNQYYQLTLKLPEIRFDLKGLCAGQALPTKQVVRLNVDLAREYGADFIHDTLPHEVAHLVAWSVWGRRIKPHGPEWQSVMQFLGVSAERCHRYACQPTRKLKRYRYTCVCREHEVTSIRHNRMRRGTRYTCRYCHTTLKPVVA